MNILRDSKRIETDCLSEGLQVVVARGIEQVRRRSVPVASLAGLRLVALRPLTVTLSLSA